MTGQVAPDRSALLAARPLPRPGIHEQCVGEASLRLAVPVPRRRLARWLTGSDRPVWRKFELDAMGTEVWRMLDGKLTVRDIIQQFAASHQLNLREAEVSILAYLRMLAARGMMMLAVEGQEDGRPASTGN